MSETDHPDSAPAPTVWGTFQAKDARAMLDFLVAVGFEATAVYADDADPSFVHHAQLDWPEGGGLMFGSHKDGDWSLTPGSAGFYVVSADPRTVLERATAAGAEITRPLQESDYGSTEFAFRDPEGNRWSVGTYRGVPRKAD